MYLLGSLAISVVVPDATLELTSGASQAFTVYADGFGVPGLSNVLSGLLVRRGARRVDRLDRRAEPQHVARRQGRLPAEGAAEDEQERRPDAAAAAPGRRRDRAVVRVRRGAEHVVGVRRAAGRLDLALHADVRLHVRRRDQAAPVAARPRATDPDPGPAGDRRASASSRRSRRSCSGSPRPSGYTSTSGAGRTRRSSPPA